MKQLQLKVPKSLYNEKVVLKTSYMFLDDLYIHIGDLDNEWIVNLKGKSENINIEEFNDKFENELILQSVRRNVFEQTGKIRELLMARAMASTIIDENDEIQLDNSVDEGDLDEILKSWFDVYEK